MSRERAVSNGISILNDNRTLKVRMGTELGSYACGMRFGAMYLRIPQELYPIEHGEKFAEPRFTGSQDWTDC